MKAPKPFSPAAMEELLGGLIPETLPAGMSRHQVSGNLRVESRFDLSPYLTAIIESTVTVHSYLTPEYPHQKPSMMNPVHGAATIGLYNVPDAEYSKHRTFLTDWRTGDHWVDTLNRDALISAILHELPLADLHEFPCNEKKVYSEAQDMSGMDALKIVKHAAATHLIQKMDEEGQVINLPLDEVLISCDGDVFNGHGECLASTIQVRPTQMQAMSETFGWDLLKQAWIDGVFGRKPEGSEILPIREEIADKSIEKFKSGYSSRLFVKWHAGHFAKIKEAAGPLEPFARFPDRVAGQDVAILMLKMHLGMDPQLETPPAPPVL